jgi:drug/metabolite transporter (DMT)-like permease
VGFLLAAASAACYALGVVLQFQGAQQADRALALRLGLLTLLARRPRWLCGVAANVVGFALRLAALRRGSLVVVQPVVLTGIVVALPLESLLARRRLVPRDLGMAAATVAGLAVFLAAAHPSVGQRVASGTAWIGFAAVVVVLLAALFAVGARSSDSTHAVCLAIAGGLLAGVVVCLAKQVAGTAPTDAPSLLTSWPAYALIAVGLVSVVVVQSAYQVGRLATCVPVILVIEPLVSVIVGVVMFHERTRAAAGWRVVQALGLALLVVGSAALVRSSAERHEARGAAAVTT